MKLHILEEHQILPAPPEEVWNFFATPANLNEITPPDMGFRPLSGDGEPMFAGQIITYKIAVFPGIWWSWVTEISAVEPGRYFIDEQRSGPYCFWQHLHRFEATPEGHTRMLDRVHYALPFGILGEIPHRLFVREKLRHIFAFRRKTLEETFGAAG